MNPTEFVLAQAKRAVEALSLPAETQAYILRVLSSPPARPVSNQTGKNLLIDFACAKMGFSIQVESATVEGKFRLFLSYNKEVIAYFPQPERRVFEIIDRRGTKRDVLKTFDFLVIYSDRAEMVECKPLSWLVETSKTRPDMATLRGGHWGSPTIAEQLKESGLIFRYVTDVDIPTPLARNITVLEPVRGEKYSSEEALTAIRAVLKKPVTLHELIDGQGGYTKQDVFLAILGGDVYVNLESDLLAAPIRTYVYKNREQSELTEAITTMVAVPTLPAPYLTAGSSIRMNGEEHRFASLEGSVVQFLNPKGELVATRIDALDKLVRSGAIELPTASPLTTASAQSGLGEALDSDAFAEAKRKAFFIVAWRKDHSVCEEAYGLERCTRRQKQRWWFDYKTSARRYGNGVFGLLRRKPPLHRASQLPARSIELMVAVANELYFTQDRLSPKVCYRELQGRAAAESIHCPSYKTFRRYLRNARNREDTARARISERAAYQHSSLVVADENWLTADDFHEKHAHLDATQLDIELVDSETGRPLGRPWYTRLYCPSLHAPWAFVLSFDEPSYRDSMLVLRVAFEKWGFLPRYISVDNGSEFAHTAFDQLLAVFGAHKVVRPPAQSRFGSAIESSFKRLLTECLNVLRGNTQSTKNVRQLTKASNPKTRAVWTLPLLHDHLVAYDQTVWETIAPELGTSPKEAFATRKNYTPDMPRIALASDLAAVVFMPPPPQWNAIVQPGRGVCISGIYYWNENFRNAKIERTKVEVRYDPFDFAVAFARIEGVWQRCCAKHYPRLLGCTEKQMRIAILERRHARRLYPSLRDKERGGRLLLLDRNARKTQKMLLQQRRDAEARAVRGPSSEGQKVSKKAAPEIWSFGHLRDNDGPTTAN